MQAHEVQAWFDGQHLCIRSKTIDRIFLLKEIQWQERSSQGGGRAFFPDGTSLVSEDIVAWDAWVRAQGREDSWLVRLEHSWTALILITALLIGLGASAYVWGLPLVAKKLAQYVPQAIEAQIGETLLEHLQPSLKPSKLTQAEQQAIIEAWDKVLQAHTEAQKARGVDVRATRLLIMDGKIGPNAMAVAGGTILLTDDMVRLVQHDTDLISGILAHELGHIQNRHGLQMLIQVSALSLFVWTILGDYSAVLATVPLVLGQAHYSRKSEREADAYSALVLRDADLDPSLMFKLFERLMLFRQCGYSLLQTTRYQSNSACKQDQPPMNEEDNSGWKMGFASHPSDESRIKFFQGLATD